MEAGVFIAHVITAALSSTYPNSEAWKTPGQAPQTAKCLIIGSYPTSAAGAGDSWSPCGHVAARDTYTRTRCCSKGTAAVIACTLGSAAG